MFDFIAENLQFGAYIDLVFQVNQSVAIKLL